MFSTAFSLRLVKALSVLSIGIMAFIIVIGNVTDYYSNYYFVEHVMKMDTTFPGSNLRYRNINNPIFFHAVYVIIIILEMVMCIFCLVGSWKLFKHLKSDAPMFHESKKWAIAGLALGMLIWFFGFEVVGGEWFAMWQSATWNGLASAERIVSFIVLTLILLHLKDESLPNANKQGG